MALPSQNLAPAFSPVGGVGTVVAYNGYLWRYLGNARWEPVGSAAGSGQTLGTSTSTPPPQPQPKPSGGISSFEELVRNYPGYAGWNPEAAFADFRATGGAGKGPVSGGGGAEFFTPPPEEISEAERQELRRRLEQEIYPYYDALLQRYIDQLNEMRRRTEEDKARREQETTRTVTENIARRGLTFSGIRGQELSRALDPIRQAVERALKDIATREEEKRRSTELEKRQALETTFEGALGRARTRGELASQMESANLKNLLRLYGIGV